MNEKFVLVISFLLSAGIIVIAGQPVNEWVLPVDEFVSSSFELPFDASVSGMAVSGEWSGYGRSMVWLEGESERLLILDTALLNSKRFESSCVESCYFEGFDAKRLVVFNEGSGIYLRNAEFIAPSVPISMATCPGCQKVALAGVPNHQILAIVVMMLLLVVSAHVMKSVCKNNTCKRGSLGVFIGGAGILLALFGVSVVSLDGSVGAFVQYATSVFAAVGVIVLFALGAVELVSRGHEWQENQK